MAAEVIQFSDFKNAREAKAQRDVDEQRHQALVSLRTAIGQAAQNAYEIGVDPKDIAKEVGLVAYAFGYTNDRQESI